MMVLNVIQNKIMIISKALSIHEITFSQRSFVKERSRDSGFRKLIQFGLTSKGQYISKPIGKNEKHSPSKRPQDEFELTKPQKSTIFHGQEKITTVEGLIPIYTNSIILKILATMTSKTCSMILLDMPYCYCLNGELVTLYYY